MDNIDITDAEFSLDIPSSIKVDSSDETSYLYFGIAVIIAIFGFTLYKVYYKVNKTNEDCEGGFCTMDSHPKNG